MPEVHSTGRGGAGNIGEDPTTYVDGSIVREGPQGQSATNGDYSTGRGGAGNIDALHTHRNGGPPHSGTTTASARRIDEEVIPEPAMHEKHYENFHTGRGGQGNVHKDKYGGHSKPQSAAHMAAAHGESSEETAAAKKREQEQGQSHGVGEKIKSLFGGAKR